MDPVEAAIWPPALPGTAESIPDKSSPIWSSPCHGHEPGITGSSCDRHISARRLEARTGLAPGQGGCHLERREDQVTYQAEQTRVRRQPLKSLLKLRPLVLKGDIYFKCGPCEGFPVKRVARFHACTAMKSWSINSAIALCKRSIPETFRG
jgi:hypothetical protein